MTTDIVKRRDELITQIRSEKFSLELLAALPENVSVEKFTRVTVTALMQNPDLPKLEPMSIYQALLRAAADGLLPDGREAAVVGFKDKAQYLPMVGGYRKIAGEYGWALEAFLAYANDQFEYQLGLNPNLVHVPVRPGADRGPVIAVYAIASNGNGRKLLDVMTVGEIEKIRGVSRSKDKGPWVEWWDQMAKKTVVKRLFKSLPFQEDARIVRVLAADLEPGEAAMRMYGELPPPPAEGEEGVEASEEGVLDGEGEEVDGGDGDAEPAADDTAAAATVDPSPEPDVGSGEFDPPAAVKDETKIAREMADEAGATVIPSGKHEGKSLARVVSEQGGEGWLLWVLQRPTLDIFGAARTFAAVYHPDLLQAAGETKGEA